MTTVRDGVTIALEPAGAASGPMEDSDVHAPSSNSDAVMDEVILDMCAPEDVKWFPPSFLRKDRRNGAIRLAQRFLSAASQR